MQVPMLAQATILTALTLLIPTVPVWSTSSSHSKQSHATQQASQEKAQPEEVLKGSVTVTTPNAFGDCISDLLSTASQKNDEIVKLNDVISRYGAKGHLVAARAADALNYTLMYKGISPSSEAGDIILNEKNKVKSLASAKYVKQKLADELHLRVLTDVMQMAMGMGNSDATDGASQVSQAQADLESLVGKEQSQRVAGLLKNMQEHEAKQAQPITRPIWTVSETQQRLQSAVSTAAINDPIVKELQDDIHKYNKHKTATLVAHRVTRVALSTVSLSPSVVGPAAQAAMFGFLFATGGTEQEKLLKELYLDKRLSSRAHLLNEEAHLALENYQLAAMTDNKLLMSCSQMLVEQMVGTDESSKLLSAGQAEDASAVTPNADVAVKETPLRGN